MANANSKQVASSGASYLDEFAGAGQDEFKAGGALSQAYLSMVQPGSQPEADGHKAGTWRNSATNENYGELVRVVPVAFKIVWVEQETNGRTVARYEPNSIEVVTTPPKSGTRGYPKMVNPASQNEVKELFMYAVMLPDYPDAGVLFFCPTAGNMKACRGWNNQINSALLPNGKHAPIFGYTWNLGLELVQNPQKPSEQIARIVGVKKDAIIDEGFFTEKLKPQIPLMQQELLAVTADPSTEETD